MSGEPPSEIHCDEHGASNPCMVCVHLISGARKGFHAAQDPNPDPEWAHLREAWCDRCDRWWGFPQPLVSLYNWLVPSPIMVCERCLARFEAAHGSAGRELGWWERK